MADKAESKGKKQREDSHFVRQKRAPPCHFPKQKNEFYVNRKSDFKYQLERAQKLLDSGYNEIFIYGLGAAINRAVNLALQLEQRGLGSIQISAETSSTHVVDDLKSLDDEHESYSEKRTKSSIKIKVFKTVANE